MKYFVACLAVIVEFFVYSIICGMLGFRHGGGVLIILLSYAVYAATWRAIVKNWKDKKSTTEQEDVSLDSEDNHSL